MHLRNKETGEEFHVPSGMGKALIATGTVEEVIPLPGPEIEVRWYVSPGQRVEDYLNPPVISWAGSGNSGYHASTDGTSHLKCKSYVPGVPQQTCPKDIAAEYLRLFAEWSSKRKKPTKPSVGQVSAHTPGKPSWNGYIAGSPWQRDYELRTK